VTTFYVAVCGECESYCSLHSPTTNREFAAVEAGSHDVQKHRSATKTHDTARVESFESDKEYPQLPPLSEFVEIDTEASAEEAEV
jgi:hypothetical protein